MATSQLNEEQLKDALCEVRKAHRLVYEYQRRMQDLSWFIRNKLGFNEYKGFKKFSAPLSSRNTISVDNWSWDWIYSYVYEYYMGEQSEKDYCWRVSIFQVSDTGFYKNRGNGARQTKISTFADVKESDSKVIFYLSAATKSAKEYDWDTDNIIKEYAIQDGFFKIENTPKHIQIVYSVPLSKFVSEEAIMLILRDFVEYCNKNAGVNLKIQE